MSDALSKSARETLLVGMRNAHALERQAISILEPQLARLADYPDLRARLQRHIEESQVQAQRLESALERHDTSPSAVKDTVLSVMGMAQSTMAGLADDAVLKASFSNIAFEHFEIASYRSMLELVDLAGMPELRPNLEASLREEEAMAAWLEQNLGSVTRRYVELEAGLEPSGAGGSAQASGMGVPLTSLAGTGPTATTGPAMGETGVDAPLRDLEEFTDRETKPDAWPSGHEAAGPNDVTGNS